MVAQGGAAGGTQGKPTQTIGSPEGAMETCKGSSAPSGLETSWADTQGSAYGSTLGYHPAPLRGLKTAPSQGIFTRKNLRAAKKNLNARMQIESLDVHLRLSAFICGSKFFSSLLI